MDFSKTVHKISLIPTKSSIDAIIISLLTTHAHEITEVIKSYIILEMYKS